MLCVHASTVFLGHYVCTVSCRVTILGVWMHLWKAMCRITKVGFRGQYFGLREVQMILAHFSYIISVTKTCFRPKVGVSTKQLLQVISSCVYISFSEVTISIFPAFVRKFGSEIQIGHICEPNLCWYFEIENCKNGIMVRCNCKIMPKINIFVCRCRGRV